MSKTNKELMLLAFEELDPDLVIDELNDHGSCPLFRHLKDIDERLTDGEAYFEYLYTFERPSGYTYISDWCEAVMRKAGCKPARRLPELTPITTPLKEWKGGQS